jgi:hypothetical protein
MSNELFVELSDEQQELIAGGDAALALLNATKFQSELNAVGGNSFSAATPAGALGASGGFAIDQDIESASISTLLAVAN